METGDLIICKDVVGIITDTNDALYFTVLLSDDSKIQLSKTADIHVISNAYAIAALIYRKLVSMCGK